MAHNTRSSAPYQVVTALDSERAATATDVDTATDTAAFAPRWTLAPLRATRSSIPPSVVPADTRYEARAGDEGRREPELEATTGSAVAQVAPAPASCRRLTERV